MKPLIGILPSISQSKEDKILGLEKVFVSRTYVEAVEQAGGIPIIIPVNINEESIKQQIGLVDGVIISGGVDVNPVLYNEEPKKELGYICADRDYFDLMCVRFSIDMNKPIFGICRGIQVINVALGGNVYQDISYTNSDTKHFQEAESYMGTHYIDIKKDSILYEILGDKALVNSFHHQCIKDLAEGLEPIAHSRDNIIEAVQSIDDNFIIGVQWHPEMMFDHDDKMLDIFKLFVKKTIS